MNLEQGIAIVGKNQSYGMGRHPSIVQLELILF